MARLAHAEQERLAAEEQARADEVAVGEAAELKYAGARDASFARAKQRLAREREEQEQLAAEVAARKRWATPKKKPNKMEQKVREMFRQSENKEAEAVRAGKAARLADGGLGGVSVSAAAETVKSKLRGAAYRRGTIANNSSVLQLNPPTKAVTAHVFLRNVDGNKGKEVEGSPIKGFAATAIDLGKLPVAQDLHRNATLDLIVTLTTNTCPELPLGSIAVAMTGAGAGGAVNVRPNIFVHDGMVMNLLFTLKDVGLADAAVTATFKPAGAYPLAKAAVDFKPTQGKPDNQIGFNAGDMIVVKGELGNGWWMGHVDGTPNTEGLFPGDYLEEMPPAPARPALSLSCATDAEGRAQTCLPRGRLSQVVARKTMENGETCEICKAGGVSVTPSVKGAPNEHAKPTTIGISRDSTNFASVFNDSMVNEASVVFLGDRSGSMNGRLLDVLKKNMVDLVSKAVKRCGCVGVGAWDHEHDLFANGTWVTTKNLDDAKVWIDHISARGGTCLGQAVEGALRRFGATIADTGHKGITDVYVLTDGAMHDFDARDPNTEMKWRTLRAQHPDVTFHFIAIGDAAEAGISELLQRMADIGEGDFHQYMA